MFAGHIFKSYTTFDQKVALLSTLLMVVKHTHSVCDKAVRSCVKNPEELQFRSLKAILQTRYNELRTRVANLHPAP